MKNPVSLQKQIRQEITKWSLIGLLISSLFAIFAVIGMGVLSSETQLKTVAQAAAKAFRPSILSGDIKNVELQIRNVFHFDEDETVQIVDPNLLPYYRLQEGLDSSVRQQHCTQPEQTCWDFRKWQIGTLVPIYFDQAKQELFGYLDVRSKPRFDIALLACLFVILIFAAVFQATGLSSRLIRYTQVVGQELSNWAAIVEKNPKSNISLKEAPYEELVPLQKVLAGLNQSIEQLEKKAMNSAQTAIIRGIAHDILTPVSQLKKLFSLLDDISGLNNKDQQEIREGINHSLSRLTYLARQTKTLRENHEKENIQSCDLVQTTALSVSRLSMLDQVKEKNVKLEISSSEDSVLASVQKGDCERILDNLVLNAVEASQDSGRIEIRISKSGHSAFLSVKDFGHGIPTNIREKIFDLDFTTRPGSGTGLGLAIVKQLCQRSNAQIDFESIPREGSEFRITFKHLNERSTQ